MNPDEIDVMKLTPEEHRKMRERCKELERDSIRQCERIQNLERINAQLSDTINRMEGGCAKAIELRQLLDELFGIRRNEVVSDDEIRKKMKNLQNVIAQLRKENYQVYDQCNQLADEKKQQDSYILELREELERIRREANNSMDSSQTALKDADAKIQSANDRAANAKKEAKEAKERAESASERVRYLERKLRDVESLNDALMKELARRQGCQAEIREHDADIYQLDVLKYAPDYHDYLPNVLYAAIGMCGEAGEVSELIKKYAYHGHTIDTEHLARELGDVLWYVSYLAHLFGYPLGKIMAMNQEKLAKRYPDGKFDAERSRNRKDGDI